MTENDTANPCVLCDIGCEYTEYHKMRHLQDPKKVDDFNAMLLNEPLEDFDHPPFDDVDMMATADDFFDDIEFIDSDEDMDYEDMDNITYLDKTI